MAYDVHVSRSSDNKWSGLFSLTRLFSCVGHAGALLISGYGTKERPGGPGCFCPSRRPSSQGKGPAPAGPSVRVLFWWMHFWSAAVCLLRESWTWCRVAHDPCPHYRQLGWHLASSFSQCRYRPVSAPNASAIFRHSGPCPAFSVSLSAAIWAHSCLTVSSKS